MCVLLSEDYYPDHGDPLQIHFDEIPADGLWLEITDESWFPDHDVTKKGPVAATIYLEKRGERVLVEGTIKTIFVLECDRCLESFYLPVENKFKVDLELADKAMLKEHPIAEHSCSSNEMDVMFLDEPLIDIFYVLQQQVYLALPDKKICKPECQGLCPKCGANLNEERCKCSTAPESSPFAVLKKLKQ